MTARAQRAETPLGKLSRIVGGLLLSNGPLAHQVLGQLLILNQREIELAAASVAIAATSGHKDAAISGVVRVLAPATALHFLTRRDSARLRALVQAMERRELSLLARERAVSRSERRRSRRSWPR